jgi:hypothetical protein
MTYVDPAAPPNVGEIPAAFRYIQWGPVIAGALLAAALASVLHTFAAAIGLSMSSTAPTWRDTSFVLVLLSGLYLLLVAFLSYGLGVTWPGGCGPPHWQGSRRDRISRRRARPAGLGARDPAGRPVDIGRAQPWPV